MEPAIDVLPLIPQLSKVPWNLQWRKGLTLIHWIKKINFNTKPTWGWSCVCHHPPAPPTIELGGGIDYVEYDWLAFSTNAISIYGGEIRINTRIEDPKELRSIAVPKSVFRERPEIMVGISGFRYEGESPGVTNLRRVLFPSPATTVSCLAIKRTMKRVSLIKDWMFAMHTTLSGSPLSGWLCPKEMDP